MFNAHIIPDTSSRSVSSLWCPGGVTLWGHCDLVPCDIRSYSCEVTATLICSLGPQWLYSIIMTTCHFKKNYALVQLNSSNNVLPPVGEQSKNKQFHSLFLFLKHITCMFNTGTIRIKLTHKTKEAINFVLFQISHKIISVWYLFVTS